MDSDLFIALITAISAAVASIIPSLKSLTDKRFKWYKRLTSKGWLTILSLFISIGLTFYQLYRNKEEARIKEEIASRNLNNRDITERARYDSLAKTLKKNFDSTVTVIVKTGYDALAKYGLRLDYTEKKIVKGVRDSASYQYKRLENSIASSKKQQDSIRAAQIEIDMKKLNRTLSAMGVLYSKNRDMPIQYRTIEQNREWINLALSFFQSESDNTFLKQNKPAFEQWIEVTAELKRQSQFLSDSNPRYRQTRDTFYDDATQKKMLSDTMQKTTMNVFDAVKHVGTIFKPTP